MTAPQADLHVKTHFSFGVFSIHHFQLSSVLLCLCLNDSWFSHWIYLTKLSMQRKKSLEIICFKEKELCNASNMFKACGGMFRASTTQNSISTFFSYLIILLSAGDSTSLPKLEYDVLNAWWNINPRGSAQEKWINVIDGNYGIFMFIYLLILWKPYNAHKFLASYVLINLL